MGSCWRIPGNKVMHHFSGHQSRRACALWGPEAGGPKTAAVRLGVCQISHGPKKGGVSLFK